MARMQKEPCAGNSIDCIMRAMSEENAITHPLAGAQPQVIAYWLNEIEDLSANSLSRLKKMKFSGLCRYPMRPLEAMLYRQGMLRYGPVQSPIFILGHWRSGTTHLYNILSKSAGFASVFPLEAGLPGDILFLGRFVRPFLAKALPETRLIDRVEVNIRLL